MSDGKKSFVERMIGAAMLDVGTYEEVEHDMDATLQAAGAVALVAVCAAIGGTAGGQGGIIGRPIASLLGWLVWSGVTFLIGTRLFDGQATWGEMMRTIGFAHAPGVLLAFAAFPVLGGLIGFVVGIWMLVAGFIAIRQGLDISNGKTLVTVLLGWVAGMAIGFVIAIVFGIPAAIIGSIAS